MLRALRRTAVAGCGYLVAAVVFSWPLPLHLGDKVLGLVSGDTGVYIWNLWVFRHEILAHHQFPFFTSQILSLAPPVNLGLHNYTLFADLVALPLIPLLGVVRSFNALQLASTVASGLAMFVLARRVTGRTAESWLAGLLFACSPFLVARSTAHFSLVQAAPLPVFAWFLLAAIETRRARHAVGAGAAIAWATMSDPYYGVYCLMLGGVLLLARVVRVERRRAAGRGLLRAADGGVVACAGLIFGIAITGGTRVEIAGLRLGLTTLYTPVLVASVLVLLRLYLTLRPRVRLDAGLPLRPVVSGLAAAGAACLAPLTPMLYSVASRLRDGGSLRREIFWRSSPPGVDLLAYLAPNPNHPILGASAREMFARRHDAIEDVASLTVVGLAVVLVAAWRGWRPSRLWIAVTLVFGALSLGPFLHIAGVETYVPGPWALLRYVPLIGAARMPARLAIVAMLGFSVVFAQALAWLRARSARPALLLTAVAAALVFELAPAPRLLYPADIPEVYRTIAADPADVAVLQLPFGIRDGTTSIGQFNTAYQFYQTQHQKRLVGGYLSRVPLRLIARERRQFPVLDALVLLSEGQAPAAQRLAEAASRGPAFVERAGLGYVVVDRSRASRDLVDFAIGALRLEKVQESFPFELYRPRRLSGSRPS